MFNKRAAKPEGTIINTTPLDEVRQEEAKIESLILLAQQEAEIAKQKALMEAEQLKEQARQSGFQAGQARCETLLQQASFEAERLIEEAQVQAKTITQLGQQRIPEAARWAADFVLGETKGPRP